MYLILLCVVSYIRYLYLIIIRILNDTVMHAVAPAARIKYNTHGRPQEIYQGGGIIKSNTKKYLLILKKIIFLANYKICQNYELYEYYIKTNTKKYIKKKKILKIKY